MGLLLLSHFLTSSVVTMQAKLYEGQSDINTFSWHWCVLFTKHTNKMSTSKTQNIFVYPMWGPVLPNSGALWALDLCGDPVLDNMALPWVPKCMFIKCTQTTLKLPCFSSQTRQACHPNDANFLFNLQL